MSIDDITFNDLSDIADESGAKRQKITSEQVATAEDDAQIEAEKARKVAEEQAAKEQLKKEYIITECNPTHLNE